MALLIFYLIPIALITWGMSLLAPRHPGSMALVPILGLASGLLSRPTERQRIYWKDGLPFVFFMGTACGSLETLWASFKPSLGLTRTAAAMLVLLSLFFAIYRLPGHLAERRNRKALKEIPRETISAWEGSPIELPSPDGCHVARMDDQMEFCMGGPTTGTLRVSDICMLAMSPSMAWSEDGRFLAASTGSREGYELILIDIPFGEAHTFRRQFSVLEIDRIHEGWIEGREDPINGNMSFRIPIETVRKGPLLRFEYAGDGWRYPKWDKEEVEGDAVEIPGPASAPRAVLVREPSEPGAPSAKAPYRLSLGPWVTDCVVPRTEEAVWSPDGQWLAVPGNGEVDVHLLAVGKKQHHRFSNPYAEHPGMDLESIEGIERSILRLRYRVAFFSESGWFSVRGEGDQEFRVLSVPLADLPECRPSIQLPEPGRLRHASLTPTAHPGVFSLDDGRPIHPSASWSARWSAASRYLAYLAWRPGAPQPDELHVWDSLLAVDHALEGRYPHAHIAWVNEEEMRYACIHDDPREPEDLWTEMNWREAVMPEGR